MRHHILLLLIGVLATPHLQAAYQETVLADNPAGYWRLDPSDPSPSAPVTNRGFLGAAVDGTIVGDVALNTDTPLVGDGNPSLDFTSGGRIAIPFDPALNRTNAFSYEVWYLQTGGTSSDHKCPLWWRDEPVLGDTRGWVHYVVGEGNWFQSSDVYTTWDGLGATTLFAQDVWQHVVCTFDGKVKKIYLNGVLIAVSTTAKLAVKPVQRPVNTISSGSFPWVGSLDEVAIYTNALPVERVQAHYIAARGERPPAIPPSFAVDAAGKTAYEGAVVTIRTIALGTAPFSYQWYKGATAVPGQTTETLTLSPAKESDSGDYKLVVNTPGGAADSKVASVVILKAPPTIVTQPRSAIRLQGASATFTVESGGSEPLTYQWKSNNIAVPDARAASFTIHNVQPSFAANYSVSISNAAGSKESAPASLTVVPVSPGSLAATVVADHPVAYWRLDEPTGATAALDYAGGHDGSYDTTVALGQPGGPLGDANPSAAFSYGGAIVPFTPELNPYTTFSLEAWVKPDAAAMGTDRPILWSSTSYSGWAYGYILAVSNEDAWVFTTGQKTSGFNTLNGGSATDGAWHHVVATFDDATGDKRLYVNGQLVAQTTTATGTFAPNQVTPDNTAAPDQGIGWNLLNATSFYGGLDEIAFYDYALTDTEVAAHFAAGGAPPLSISTAAGQVTVTWTLGRLLESADPASGSWSPVTGASPPAYTVSPPSKSARFFRVAYP